MKKLLIPFLLFVTVTANAQYKVRFVINKFPTYHTTSDTVYIAGNFNSWNPKDERFRLKNGGITIELKKA